MSKSFILTLCCLFLSTANAIPSSAQAIIDDCRANSCYQLNLNDAGLTTLPAGIFDGLTNTARINLRNNALTTLPAGLFDDMTNLQVLDLKDAGLTTLPAGIFDGLTNVQSIKLENNALTTLPAGLFDDMINLQVLDLGNNALTTLPAGLFDGFTNFLMLDLENNALTTLPAGIFDTVKALLMLDEEVKCDGPASVTCEAAVGDQFFNADPVSTTSGPLAVSTTSGPLAGPCVSTDCGIFQQRGMCGGSPSACQCTYPWTGPNCGTKTLC